MAIKLPWRSPNPIVLRSAVSGGAVALLAFWLAGGGFGVGEFLALIAALSALAVSFSEWRRVGHSLLALALASAGLLAGSPASLPRLPAALAVGFLAALLFLAASPFRDPRRLAIRTAGIAIIFLAALTFFTNPVAPRFLMLAVTTALTVWGEARGWGALRVGTGRFLGVTFGFLGAELAVMVSLLPLGAVRSATLVALTLLLAREGIAEAYQGGLRHSLIAGGVAGYFVLAVLLFASVPWTP